MRGDTRNENISDEMAHRLRGKLWTPEFPHNLTEEEWRAYVFERLEGLNTGFGKRLNDLRKWLEARLRHDGGQ